ncbi:MAG TPA: hypothetical protein VKS20_04130 [Candidatus Acidoferrales bacterium]|nr:hypothetical protein [Candidatus Acidoferrales bacterium]
MKHSVMLTIASLLSILLLLLHITDDIVRGLDKVGPISNIALAVVAVLLYGTLVLAERRSGYTSTLVVGIFAVGMPAIHLRGTGIANIVKTSGGFFFLFTLFALGVIGVFTIILSVRGLWNPQWGKSRAPK